MGKNTDFTGIALLLGLGFLVYKFWGFKMPTLPAFTWPSLPTAPTFIWGNGQVPYQPSPYRPPYQPPPPLELPEEMARQAARRPRPIPDLHKALKETTGRTARFIIERGIAPVPPKITQVKDLHKEMTALKTQTAIWIAERPELWGGENGR